MLNHASLLSKCDIVVRSPLPLKWPCCCASKVDTHSVNALQQHLDTLHVCSGLLAFFCGCFSFCYEVPTLQEGMMQQDCKLPSHASLCHNAYETRALASSLSSMLHLAVCVTA